MNHPLVSSGEYEKDDIINLSNENFDKFLEAKYNYYLQEGTIAAGIITLSVHLFPFFIHYFKGNISKEQFIDALKKFVPDITATTLNRVLMLTLMGPIFGWFLLSSFLLKISTHENDNIETIKQLFYKPLV